MPTSFSKRLLSNFDKYGQLCVGVDPHGSILESWGLSESISGLDTFANTVLDSAIGRVGFIKPQVSFFERFGSKGFAVLEQIALRAAESDLQVIMDAKRGDIGSTMQGYFDAWLSRSAPFVCDALTVSPYLGFDSLNEVLSQAIENGKGVFVLAATSNPEGKSLQRALINQHTIAADILEKLESVNQITLDANSDVGNFGAVVGATLNFQTAGIQHLYDDEKLVTPILAPGFGAQGANLSECRELFGTASGRVLASVSRSVLSAGAVGLPVAIDNARRELVQGLTRD